MCFTLSTSPSLISLSLPFKTHKAIENQISLELFIDGSIDEGKSRKRERERESQPKINLNDLYERVDVDLMEPFFGSKPIDCTPSTKTREREKKKKISIT